jgi:hypothetical protein
MYFMLCANSATTQILIEVLTERRFGAGSQIRIVSVEGNCRYQAITRFDTQTPYVFGGFGYALARGSALPEVDVTRHR